jgi:hypothetical protein
MLPAHLAAVKTLSTDGGGGGGQVLVVGEGDARRGHATSFDRRQNPRREGDQVHRRLVRFSAVESRCHGELVPAYALTACRGRSASSASVTTFTRRTKCLIEAHLVWLDGRRSDRAFGTDSNTGR